MIREEDVFPINTVVRFKKTGLFAVIKQVHRFKDGSYQHYLGEIENKKGLYVIYHQDCDLVKLP